MSTKSNKPAAQAHVKGNVRPAEDLVLAIFDLLNDDISDAEWLELLAHFGSCASASCIWWPAGMPDYFDAASHGPRIELSNADLAQLDAIVEAERPTRPGLMDRWAAQHTQMSAAEQETLFPPNRLIACIDWAPARVLLVLEERHEDPRWEEFDRQHFHDILPVVRKDVRVRKRISQREDIADLALQVFDEIPRAFVVMTPEAEVIIADRVARTLLNENALLGEQDSRLQLRDLRQQHKFSVALQKLAELPKQQLGDFMWHARLTDPKDGDNYIAIMKGFPFKFWRPESSAFDRMAVLVLQNRNMMAPLTPEKIAAMYPLTPAQARVAAALVDGETAEQVADALSISVNTVRSHLQAIYARLDIENKSQLLALLSAGIAEPNFERY